eukprot:4258183-Amphidinium_carterae.1
MAASVAFTAHMQASLWSLFHSLSPAAPPALTSNANDKLDMSSASVRKRMYLSKGTLATTLSATPRSYYGSPPAARK